MSQLSQYDFGSETWPHAQDPQHLARNFVGRGDGTHGRLHKSASSSGVAPTRTAQAHSPSRRTTEINQTCTSDNAPVEFTLNAPFTIALSKPWALTLEPNFGVLRNADNTRYRENCGFIANLSRPVLVEGLTAAVEVAVDVSSEGKERTRVSFDPSLQYLLTKNLQVDAGVYLGLNKATQRYLPYAGISYRF